jgi:hypothetical protein
MIREVRTVDDIMRLLFGREDGLLSELFDGDDADGFGMADRARRAGEWCGTTPGRGSAAGGAGRATAPRGVPRHFIDRKFRIF